MMPSKVALVSALLLTLGACTEWPQNDSGPAPDGVPRADGLALPIGRDASPAAERAPHPLDSGSPPTDQSGTSADSVSAPPPDKGTPLPDAGASSADSASPAPDVKIPARELLLFDDAHRQFTASDKGFHDLIKPGDPIPADNWLSPVDYNRGEMQIRYLVEGPTDQAAGKLQTCIWTMGDADGDGRNWFPEACSAQVAHTGPGTYFNTRLVPADWWKNEGVPLDFSHPERFQVRVVLRGESGCNVTTYNVSKACWDQWPLYEQMKFRVTIVMVPAGTTFSGWQNYP